jgi:hypothetical protein
MPRLTAVLPVLAATCLLAVPSAARETSLPPFWVGFAEDLPKETGADATDAARGLGATALRVTTQWSSGRTELDPAETARLDRAVAAAPGLRLFLSVYGASGDSAPRDEAARDQYCGFVRSVLLRYPAIRDVVVWNEPNKRLFWNPQVAAPAEYAALLARCYDVLHAAVPGVRVIGLALSPSGHDNQGSYSPGVFIRAVGDAYRASGRAAPLFDAVAHHPYPPNTAERPWTKHVESRLIAQGDWNKLMRNLSLAFAGTGQPLPGECAGSLCPVIWYTEVGFQTNVDPAKAAAYTGVETETTLLPPDAGGESDATGALAPDQRTQVNDAVRLAACQPYVAGFLNFLLADEPRLEGWQSGALWADRTEKPSAAAFREAFAEAAARKVDCAELEGDPPSADYEPPPPPGNLRLTSTTSELELEWDAVDDPSGPVDYRVYRDGAHVATVETPRYAPQAGQVGSRYVVRAIDAAGNLGDASPETRLP